jgi:hypothetical protein
MEFKTTIFLGIALTIAVSGCIDVGIQEEVEPDHPDEMPKEPVDWASCENIQVQIDQVSNPAMIRQMNDKPIGEVTLDWVFENGESASKTVNLSRKGQLKFVEIENTETVQQLEVTPSRCPDRSFGPE